MEAHSTFSLLSLKILKCTEKEVYPSSQAPVHEIIPSQKTKVTEISAAGSSGKYRLQEFISLWHSQQHHWEDP